MLSKLSSFSDDDKESDEENGSLLKTANLSLEILSDLIVSSLATYRGENKE